MNNKQIAKIFNNISKILEIKNENRFKVLAYERVADIINNLNKDLKGIYQAGGIKALRQIPGVGEAISEKIAELLKTGKLKYYSRLLKDVPEKVLEITEIPGVGPKTAYTLYKELGIKDIKQLKKAAKSGQVHQLPHFKQKSEKNILRGIRQYRIRTKEKNRMVLNQAEPIAKNILKYLKANKAVLKADAVGSLRRMKETIGDVDIVIAASSPSKVVDYIAQAPFVKTVLIKGKTKISVTHFDDFRIDFEILPRRDYGSLLHHFTGSKEHNVHLRSWASDNGLKISEYGIRNLKTKKLHHFADEKSFFKFLKMQYIEPELREDGGEIELAMRNKLPKIVGYNNLRGDLHLHTKFSDGHNTVEQIAQHALKLKYKYVGISDHTVGLGVVSGLDDKKLLAHKKRIAKVDKKYKNIRLLTGAEVNIKANGKLDIKPKTVKKLDYIIGSVHSAFAQDKKTMTKRIILAVNQGINILGHPSGRKLGKRLAYAVDWPVVFKECAKNKVALEINSFPERLDLKDTLIKEALAYGCKFAIGSDAHELSHMAQVRYGLSAARRGWATKKDIINAWELVRLLKWFK